MTIKLFKNLWLYYICVSLKSVTFSLVIYFCDNVNHIIEALQDAIICLTPPRS